MTDIDKLNESEIEFARKLRSSMRNTSGARFECAKRHHNKNRTSTLAIIILSSYAIIFSMIASFVELKSNYTTQTLNLLSVFMSALIISITLFEGSKRHDLKSEIFLKCAQSIQKIQRDLDLKIQGNIFTRSDLNKIITDYNDQIAVFSDNHADLDLYNYWSKVPKYNEKGDIIGYKIDDARVSKWRIVSHNFVHMWFIPFLALLSPLILMVGFSLLRLVTSSYFVIFGIN